MIPRFLLSTLVPLVPFGLSHAQGTTAFGAPDGALRRPLDVAVGLADGADLPTYLDPAYVRPTGSVGGGEVRLLRFETGARLADLAALGALAAADPTVTFVERDQPGGALETIACGLTTNPGAAGWAGAQDCTVAFFDGTPTPEEYFDQPAMPILGSDAAHAHLPGGPSIVAVVDTGIDFSHPALVGRILGPGLDLVSGGAAWDVPNGRDDDGDGLVDEAFGHGTHVAGTIALINPQAMILPIRVLDSDGNGTAFDVARAIEFAVANGADVVNLSLGLSGHSGAVAAAVDAAHDLDVEILAAAGNTGTAGVGHPASLDHVAAVAAVDDGDVRAWFSAYGPEVEFSAPGVDVYGPMPGGLWARWSGTSMACAIASGSVSLVHTLAHESGEGAHVIEDGAWPVDVVNPTIVGQLGDGRVDLAQAAAEIFDDPSSD